MRSTILGNVNQIDPEVISGDDQEVQLSKIGQIFTADWKLRLLLAGKLWRLTVGAVVADTDFLLVTGGGAGTTMDMEQPEIMIGIPTGYFGFLVEADIACLPTDLATEINARATIMFVGDRSVGAPTSVTGTVETPVNLLDGGGAYPGLCYSAVTADLADPGTEEILAIETESYSEVGTNAGPQRKQLSMHYRTDVPSLIAGPGSICGYWFGIAAVGGAGSVVFGLVPSSWFPVT